MDFDIASKLQDWDYSPNDLNVRKIKGMFDATMIGHGAWNALWVARAVV